MIVRHWRKLQAIFCVCSVTLLACGVGGRRPARGPSSGSSGGGGGEGEGEGEGVGPSDAAAGDRDAGPTPSDAAAPGADAAQRDSGAERDTGRPGEDSGPDPTDTGQPPAGWDAGERPEHLSGVVNVTQVFVQALREEPFRGNGGAFFDEAAALPAIEGCVVVQPEAPAPSPSYDAGVLRVSGGRRELVLTPAPAGGGLATYTSNLPEDNERLFDAGDRLVFTGEGGPHVRPFEGELIAPARVSIREPAPFPQPRSGAAVRVRWAAEGADGVLVSIVSKRGTFPNAPEPVEGPTILCGGPDDGDEQVSAELMAQLPDGDGFLLGVTRILAREQAVDATTRVTLTAFMVSGRSLDYR